LTKKEEQRMVKKEKEMKPWLWNSRENMAAAA
jgi:hypothetical protein